MPEQFLTVNGIHLSEANRKKGMIKTYSFTTDDDDAVSMTNSKKISNHDKLLSANSLSIDSITNDDDVAELTTKLKKRKSRRRTEIENVIEKESPPKIKEYPSHDKLNWSKPLMVIGMLIFIYFMWLKRDIWIPRLLSSKNRFARSIMAQNEQIENELTYSSSSSLTTSTSMLPIDSLSNSSLEENTIEKVEENNEEQSENEEIDEDPTVSPTKSSSSHKTNLKLRRNKVNFSQERSKKKRNPSQDRPVTDEKKPKPILPSTSPSLTKSHHRSLVPTNNMKSLTSLDPNLSLITYNDIVVQLRKNLKSRSRDRNFFPTVLKATGLNKSQLYRLIYKKDYKILTLQTFISLLDTFNLMLLIVPK